MLDRSNNRKAIAQRHRHSSSFGIAAAFDNHKGGSSYAVTSKELDDISLSKIEKVFLRSSPGSAHAGLTLSSPLRDWASVWQVTGLLGMVVPTLVRHSGSDDDDLLSCGYTPSTPYSEMFTIGLSCWDIAIRRHLNTNTAAALKKSKVGKKASAAMRICRSSGIDAPLASWVRVWCAIDILSSIISTLRGQGYSKYGFDKACSVRDSDSSIRVDVLNTSHRRADLLNPYYKPVGHLRHSPEDVFVFRYLGTENRTLIDVACIMSNGRLDAVTGRYPGHPYSLFVDIWADTTTGISTECKHIMGLSVSRDASQKPKFKYSTDALTISQSAELLIFGRFTQLSDMRRTPMPGIAPDTWLIDITDKNSLKCAFEDHSPEAGIYLARPVSVGAEIYCRYLNAVAVAVGLTQENSFRSAKCNGKHTILTAAKGLACHAADEKGATQVASLMRIPLGTIVGHLASRLNPGTGDYLPEHGISTLQRVISIGSGIKGGFNKSPSDMSFFLRWIIFDALAGTLKSTASRYQYALRYDGGFELFVSPLFDHNDAIHDEYNHSHFGFWDIDADCFRSLFLCDEQLSIIVDSLNGDSLAIKTYRDVLVSTLAETADDYLHEINRLLQGDNRSPSEVETLLAASRTITKNLNHLTANNHTEATKNE